MRTEIAPAAKNSLLYPKLRLEPPLAIPKLDRNLSGPLCSDFAFDSFEKHQVRGGRAIRPLKLLFQAMKMPADFLFVTPQ